MVAIEIKGAAELSQKFKNFPGQVAFASSKAINDTAVAVQKFELDEQLPKKLTLRSRGSPWQKPGTKFGVNVKPFATKASLRAVVGTQADWLKLQEFGGVKRTAGHRIAIATKFWRSPKEIMAKSKKPRTVLNAQRKRRELAGRAFVYEGAKMPAGIYARAQRKSRALRMLFRLLPSAVVKPRLSFELSGGAVVAKTYNSAFERRIAEALATARLA